MKAAIRRGKGKPLHAVAHSARGDKGVSHMWFDEIKARMGDNRCFARCRLMDASRRPMRPSQTNVSPPSPIEAPSSHPSLPAALEYGIERRVSSCAGHTERFSTTWPSQAISRLGQLFRRVPRLILILVESSSHRRFDQCSKDSSHLRSCAPLLLTQWFPKPIIAGNVRRVSQHGWRDDRPFRLELLRSIALVPFVSFGERGAQSATLSCIL